MLYFNGAAAWWPRKEGGNGRKDLIPSIILLQWGRGLVAAEGAIPRNPEIVTTFDGSFERLPWLMGERPRPEQNTDHKPR